MTINFVRDNRYASINMVNWTLLDTDGVGKQIQNYRSPDRTVHVHGTFNSGTVTIQGSNQDPPVNWDTLHDPTGTAITFTTNGIRAIVENPLFIRPVLTGTAGAASVVVGLASRG